MAIAAVVHMEQGRMVPLGNPVEMDATMIGIEHKIPIIDATARRHTATVWTQDAKFQRFARRDVLREDLLNHLKAVLKS